MILDRVENAARYMGMSKYLDRALAALLKTDFHSLEEGRHDVDGDNVYILVQSPEFKAAENAHYEAHRQYIDIQLALKPGETISYAPVSALDGVLPYNEEDDILFFEDQRDGLMIRMDVGMFVVFAPQDGHRTCMGRPGDVGRKVVVKVRAS